MIDPRGRLLYVGKAKNLRARLLSYFRVKSRDRKAGKIIGQTRHLVWEQTGDEFAALLRELELIQTLRPRFNVLGLPGLQGHHYVCIGKSPAPYIYIASKPTGKEQGIYGPLVARPKTSDAVRRLNDWFKLRDCPQTVTLGFSDQPDLFPEEKSPRCLRFELQTCAGPCIGSCSRQEYGVGVRNARAFLEGRDRTLLKELENLMRTAAAEFQFEKATALRDRFTALEWLDARLSLLRHARNKQSFVYPLEGHDGRIRWYFLNRGQVVSVHYPPTSDEERQQLRGVLERHCARRPEPAALSDKVVDSVLLVAAWFRKYADERTRLMSSATVKTHLAEPSEGG
jgi:excinuclease ABC subunit C